MRALIVIAQPDMNSFEQTTMLRTIARVFDVLEIKHEVLDLYVNGKVKSFCFGIEFFHTQQGFMGTNYYASPGYPLLQRSMRLNLQWDLNN